MSWNVGRQVWQEARALKFWLPCSDDDALARAQLNVVVTYSPRFMTTALVGMDEYCVRDVCLVVEVARSS